MTLHVTITEYTTSLGDVVEKKKAYIKINEFDIGGTINSKVPVYAISWFLPRISLDDFARHACCGEE